MRLANLLARFARGPVTPSREPWIWHIDRPAYRPAGERFDVHGWVAGEGPCTLAPAAGEFEAFRWIERADLRPPPDARAWACGFQFRAEARMLVDGHVLHATARNGRRESALSWELREAVDPERKRRKLARIREELLLPGRVPRETADCLDLLPPHAARDEPSETSGYGYPENVDALVAQHAEAWILDCGAGNRPVYFDNVVNLDIAPYPATDVLADAESLPFRDASFDGVVTLAALEHVRRPWAVAAELVRVLKPGGTLIADVPFLQPVHAFPEHFFNMTSEGLRSLFDAHCDVVRVEVPRYGQPIHTLAWFLQRYAAGLPEPERNRLLQMRVADLAKPGDEQVDAPYVTRLPEASRFELASVTTLVARKR